MTESQPPEPQDVQSVQSYGQLALRDFRRNRLAVLSFCVILFIIIAAVLCPLIANQRPLYIRAAFPTDYLNSVAVAMEQVALLAQENRSPEQRAAAEALAHDHFRNLKLQLAGEDREQAAEMHDRFKKASNDRAELLALGEEMSSLFDATLSPVDRYPAIRGLTNAEVFTIAAFFAVIATYLFRRRIGSLSKGLFLILIIASVVSILWRLALPTVADNIPYRRIIETKGFGQQGERVLRTLIPYGENENIIREARQPPTWMMPSETRLPNQHWHWLGTDTNGRDVLARMVYGARVSMLIGIVAVSIYTVIGIILGAFAGYFRGWVDIAISRVIEIVICFPVLIVILAVQAFLAPSLMNIILALALLWWTGVARLQRGEFLRLVNLDYVQAVRALGGNDLRIIFVHILPNALGPILVMTSFGIAGSIVVESALSFLGFGVPQPMASWGDLLNNGRNDIRGLWWLTVFPGFAIFLTVTCFNLLGEGVRDALDPRRG